MQLLLLLWLVVGIIFEICAEEELVNSNYLFEIKLNESCIEPGFEKICSGHGICIEGGCVCDSLEEIDPLYKYSGKYCEECPYCKGQRCENVFDCLKCRNTTDCVDSCQLTLTKSLNETADEKSCLVEDENGCFVSFKYRYESGKLIVVINEHKECYNGYTVLLYVFIAVSVYILSLFALIHCLCDHCPQARKSPNRRRNVDIVRIPTSLADD